MPGCIAIPGAFLEGATAVTLALT